MQVGSIEYLRKEVGNFRKIFGDSTNSIEKMGKAFEALYYIYINSTISGDNIIMSKEEIESADMLMDSTKMEWDMRQTIMMQASVEKLLS